MLLSTSKAGLSVFLVFAVVLVLLFDIDIKILLVQCELSENILPQRGNHFYGKSVIEVYMVRKTIEYI